MAAALLWVAALYQRGPRPDQLPSKHNCAGVARGARRRCPRIARRLTHARLRRRRRRASHQAGGAYSGFAA